MDIFDRIRATTLGIHTPVPTILPDGSVAMRDRIYLDSAATCLAVRPVADAMGAYYTRCCANSHTVATTSGRDTTEALDHAHEDLGRLIGYDPARDCVLTVGSGTTSAACFAAECLKKSAPAGRDIAVVSSIEHHSNLLPWMRTFECVYVDCLDDGQLDLQHLEKLLAEHGPRVRVVAVTAVSNVTGVAPPLAKISDMVHRVGAMLFVDAAQAAAHISLNKTADRLDIVAGSGHKMYAPGSPGWLVASADWLASLDWSVGLVGGGTVDRVELSRVWLKDTPRDRYEAGTPNIPGTIGLGASARMLADIGMDAVLNHEAVIIAYTLRYLASVPGLVLYGPREVQVVQGGINRTAVVSFNVSSIPHGIVSAYLNDYAAIMTRNDCFCAQPYVRKLVAAACDRHGFCEPTHAGKTGMVRASFGIYSSTSDVDALVDALQYLVDNRDRVCAQYVETAPGRWEHRSFVAGSGFDYRRLVDEFVGGK